VRPAISQRAGHVRPGAAIVLAAIGLVGAAIALSARGREPVRASLTLAEALGTGDTLGYRRALEPRAFDFPRDHGPHDGFRTEWWYFTGNLVAEDGALLGYQLTFFRSALAPPAARDTGSLRESAWAADHAWMAHLAITEVAGKRFHAFDRFAREAVGLAGASQAPWRVWLHDWSASSDTSFPIRLRAAASDVSLDLALQRGKPPVLNGDRGLSAKGPERGNASYYYSLTRMPTTGTIRIGQRTLRVTGDSWMDREWSTSGLGADLAGWDWFALQLSDRSELMLYILRRTDGTPSPFSAATFVRPDGSSRALDASDFIVEVLDTWTSPRDRTRYPAAWRITVPTEAVDVRVVPLVSDQELNLAVRYWEGTARVDGRRRGAPVSGRAYAELTGYAEVEVTRAGPRARATPR
jgi:predicted secreted hydrolase